MKLLYTDLFCGAGGTSTGVESAKIPASLLKTHSKELPADGKCAKVIACVNHDPKAIASHAANHPDALHFTEDIRTLELSPLVSHTERMKKKYPGSLTVLWASLECTNFSKAKGGQPRDADSRTLAEHLFRYIEALQPDYIQIENVEEFMSWGDLDENGKPLSKDKGRLYLKWVQNVKKYGYDFDHRILNAADYGAYTTRKRYFGIFAKHGLPIAFPEPTHGKGSTSTKDNDRQMPLFEEYRTPRQLKPWKAVKEVLDFSDEGTTIFREKPLSEKTLERIYAGLIKFVAGGKEAFLSKQYSGHPGSKNISVDEPAGTITCIDHHAFVTTYYSPGYNRSTNEPCPTVRTKDGIGIVSPFFMNYYSGGGQLTDTHRPCPSLMTVPKQRLISCRFIDQQFGKSKPASTGKPLGCITANPKYNLISCKPWIMNTNFSNTGSSVNEPAQTITANRKWHYLMTPQFQSAGGSVEKPCFTLIAKMDKRPPYLVATEAGNDYITIRPADSPATVKIKQFMKLYGIMDIKMRMLRIPELKRIMGFPENYILTGTQADQKKFIGNAVEVNMARAMCEALFGKLIELNIFKLAA